MTDEPLQSRAMAKAHEPIDDQMAAWLTAQPIFVVATAPLADDGLIKTG